jgi:hypothetical protein
MANALPLSSIAVGRSVSGLLPTAGIGGMRLWPPAPPPPQAASTNEVATTAVSSVVFFIYGFLGKVAEAPSYRHQAAVLKCASGRGAIGIVARMASIALLPGQKIRGGNTNLPSLP